MPRTVFVTGGTGYVGVPLIRELLRRGHLVRALVRPGSGAELPREATRVAGNALDAVTYRDQVAPADTLVHLVGTPRPSPAKAAEFRRVDLVSVEAAVTAALHAGIRHFVYLSVAQPAPIMRAYVEARREGEALVRASGLAATFLRPWYVLGPGHRWPWLLVPVYAVMSVVPATSDGARRLGLVTRRQMVSALVRAVEEPPERVRVVEVPEIRSGTSR
jgi:uncharacterized protein YbjT (DUF2867 family)